MARESARVAGWTLVAAGAVYFAAELGLLEDGLGGTALIVAALVVLIHLARTVDPAWLLSGALVATMFAGHWEDLGLNADLGPNRVLLIAGVLAVLLRAPPARDRPYLHLSGAHLALLAALGYAMVSAVAVESIERSAPQLDLIDQFGVFPFVMFLVAPVAFATERQRTILLGTVVAVGAYLSITAVLEKLKVWGLVVPGYIGDSHVGLHFGRARGPFADAGADGLALYCCAVAAAIGFVVWRRPWARAAAAGVAVLAPIGVLLTVTRGAWLAAIAATLVAVMTTAGLRRFALSIGAAGVAGVLAAFALIPGLAHDASHRQHDKAPVYERENTTAAGLRMVADRPFIGFGWGRANAEMEPYLRQAADIPFTGARAGLHNVYLQYAVTLGLVGVGIWLLAMALVFGRALSERAPPELLPWQVGLKAIFVAWLVTGFFSPAHYAFTTGLVWAWAGVVWRSRSEAPVRVPAPLSREGLGTRVGQPEPH